MRQLSLAFSDSQAEIRIEWEPKLLRPSYPLVTKWAKWISKRQMALELMRLSQAHNSIEIQFCHLGFEDKTEPTEPSNSFPQDETSEPHEDPLSENKSKGVPDHLKSC